MPQIKINSKSHYNLIGLAADEYRCGGVKQPLDKLSNSVSFDVGEPDMRTDSIQEVIGRVCHV